MDGLAEAIAEVAIASDAVHQDFDTRQSLDQLTVKGLTNSSPIP
jgi:hypothetical protein